MFDTDPAPVIRPAVLSAEFRRATFGGPRRNSAPCPWVKVAIRSIPLRGVPHLQFSYFDERKNVTRNVPLANASPVVDELIAWAFGNIHITTAAEEIDLQISKKGKVLVAASQWQCRPKFPSPTIAPRITRCPKAKPIVFSK